MKYRFAQVTGDDQNPAMLLAALNNAGATTKRPAFALYPTTFGTSGTLIV